MSTVFQFEKPWLHDGLSPGGSPLALTDLGNAQRLVLAAGNRIRYSYDLKKWFAWNGQRWELDSTGEIYRAAKDAVRGMILEAAAENDRNARSKILAHQQKSESGRSLKAMIELAQSERGVAIRLADFDKDKMLLNCLNGTLDLRTATLRQHNRDDFITKSTPIEYVSDAISPQWNKFLAEIAGGNSELVEYLQRAVGYSLTGITNEQALFLLCGRGANGKTVFLETVRFVLGDYAASANFESFIQTKSGLIRSDLARLNRARFVTATESEAGKRLAEAVVKQMTGSDTVTVRFLYSENFEFRPEFKLWLATNHRPRITGQDDGIWRRLRVFDFTVSIQKAEQDRQLLEKLRSEGSGILNWALSGLSDWVAHGLSEPSAVILATSAYRQDEDVIQHFLEAQCVLANHAETRAGLLYFSYKNWANGTGEICMNQREFASGLRDRGFIKVKVGQRMGKPAGAYWKGICLKEGVTHHNENEAA
jgi:putative DNA primase/helicase